MALGKKLAIDLGTANCRVWELGKGLVLDEPTVVAVLMEDNKVLAVGQEAYDMLGKTPEYLTAVRPMKEGVIADYEVTEALLKHLLRKVMGRGWFFRPEVMICVPAGVTQVEQRAVLDATLAAGARNAFIIDQPLAAAIGAKIPVAEPAGNMIVDIGGGAAEAAIIALGGVVTHSSVRVGGGKLDEAVLAYVKKSKGLIIGEQTAERIKIELGSALYPLKEQKIRIKGRDSVYGLPKELEIDNVSVYEAIKEPLGLILGGIRKALEEAPPELIADIIERGMVLSGGTVQLKGLDKWLTEEVGVLAHIIDEPRLCVIKGVALALENIDLYRKALKA